MGEAIELQSAASTSRIAKTHSHEGYIPSIDGLRAVAVLAVFIGHLDYNILPGGFTGVDIFFVISGYVVTRSVLLREYESFGTFVSDFYRRRFRRIIPALAAMLLVVAVLDAIFIPDSWLSAANHETAKFAAFGASNIYLAAQSSFYFAPRAEFNPYLHTWSLGVEEQFYLLFPVLIAFGWRSRSLQLMVIASLCIASLAFCAFTTPSWAFYSLFSRFWELAIGMGIAIFSPVVPWKRVVIIASVAAIVVGLCIPQTAAFPFPHAILPVAGAAGLILFHQDLHFLSAKPLVEIGKVSYSLYLWHWPLIVLAKWTFGITWATIPIIIVTAFVAAFLSYRFIEMPFRSGINAPVLKLGTLTMGLLYLALSTTPQWPLSISKTADAAEWYPDRKVISPPGPCITNYEYRQVGRAVIREWTPTNCEISKKIAIVGDSHALVYQAAAGRLSQEGIQVSIYWAEGCAYLNLRSADASCGPYFNSVRNALSELSEGDTIFLPALRVQRLADQWGAINSAHRPSLEISKAIDELKPYKARIVLEAPTPIFRAPTFRCSDWFNRTNPDCAGSLSISRSEMEALRKDALIGLNQIAAQTKGAIVWDSLDLLCDEEECDALDASGRPRFFDADHLSGHGVEVIYPSLAKVLI